MSTKEDESAIVEQVRKIDWRIKFGSIKVQIREGKPTLITIEETIKLD